MSYISNRSNHSNTAIMEYPSKQRSSFGEPTKSSRNNLKKPPASQIDDWEQELRDIILKEQLRKETHKMVKLAPTRKSRPKPAPVSSRGGDWDPDFGVREQRRCSNGPADLYPTLSSAGNWRDPCNLDAYAKEETRALGEWEHQINLEFEAAQRYQRYQSPYGRRRCSSPYRESKSTEMYASLPRSVSPFRDDSRKSASYASTPRSISPFGDSRGMCSRPEEQTHPSESESESWEEQSDSEHLKQPEIQEELSTSSSSSSIAASPEEENAGEVPSELERLEGEEEKEQGESSAWEEKHDEDFAAQHQMQELSCKMVELYPGCQLPLRDSEETQTAIYEDFLAGSMTCSACTCEIDCIRDAEYVLCPVCESISPLEAAGKLVDGAFGVGLGFEVAMIK